ncbi:hypothetical protein ACRAWC_22105 [Leifsonia sp. L25]|uniref:hypothetical protein n=1 Tax=Leifsonia sp. L25 TaxID=3423957 RepID=UPI003D69859E
MVAGPVHGRREAQGDRVDAAGGGLESERLDAAARASGPLNGDGSSSVASRPGASAAMPEAKSSGLPLPSSASRKVVMTACSVRPDAA